MRSRGLDGRFGLGAGAFSPDDSGQAMLGRVDISRHHQSPCEGCSIAYHQGHVREVSAPTRPTPWSSERCPWTRTAEVDHGRYAPRCLEPEAIVPGGDKDMAMRGLYEVVVVGKEVGEHSRGLCRTARRDTWRSPARRSQGRKPWSPWAPRWGKRSDHVASEEQAGPVPSAWSLGRRIRILSILRW